MSVGVSCAGWKVKSSSKLLVYMSFFRTLMAKYWLLPSNQMYNIRASKDVQEICAHAHIVCLFDDAIEKDSATRDGELSADYEGSLKSRAFSSIYSSHCVLHTCKVCLSCTEALWLSRFVHAFLRATPFFLCAYKTPSCFVRYYISFPRNISLFLYN